MKTMKVVGVSDVKEDKNGREYKVVALSNPSKVQVVDPETGETFTATVPPLKSKVTAYKETYLDGTPSFLWDAQPGELVLGEVVTRKVEAYTIEDGDNTREVDTYTCAVLGDSSDEETWAIAISKAFRNNGHALEGEASPAEEKAHVSLAEPEEEKEEKTVPDMQF